MSNWPAAKLFITLLELFQSLNVLTWRRILHHVAVVISLLVDGSNQVIDIIENVQSIFKAEVITEYDKEMASLLIMLN